MSAAAAAVATGPLLRAQGLGRRYGPSWALRGLDMELRVGEVVGLIGQNGAGKSTLLKLLTGVEQPDTGSIELHGQRVRLNSVADAGRKGVGIVFQEQSLVPNLTVAENIILGRETDGIRGGLYSWKRLYREAERYLDAAESDVSPSALVGDLSFVDRQSVELAKVLALEERVDGPLVILFDEPTSVLTATEIERLFAQIRRLEKRSAVVFVSHRMDEVLEVSDRVMVLRDGEVVAERTREDVDENELIKLMVGVERARDFYHRERALTRHSGKTLLAAQGLHSEGAYSDIAFEIREGEVLGVAGVIGSGREALCRSIFGVQKIDGGQLRVDGKELRIDGPASAVRHGIGFIPAERRVEGIVAGRSIIENLALAGTPQTALGGTLRRPRAERQLVGKWVERLKIKAPAASSEIQRLSGGNQQKVVLAKWLAVPNLKILILDHPTRGLDVGAKADVYKAIREATEAGVGVLLLSDTLEELLGLSDRVLVMRDGRETGRFDLHEHNAVAEDIVRLMV